MHIESTLGRFLSNFSVAQLKSIDRLIDFMRQDLLPLTTRECRHTLSVPAVADQAADWPPGGLNRLIMSERKKRSFKAGRCSASC